MGRLSAGVRAVRAATVLAVGAALLAVGGCRSRESTVEYEGPFASEVRDAIPRVERAAGLRFRQPPRVEARTSADVRAFLEAQFDEETAARDLEGQVAAYKRFGLFADTLDVRQLLLDLLTEQIIGFYDPDTDVLYVVEGAREDLRETVIQHELIHALQDQYLSLDSIQNLRGDNDRAVALQAVIEGQATYEQLQAMLGAGDVAALLPGGWDRVRQTIRDQSANMPLYATAPIVLRETLVFPYLSGAEFVRRVKIADEDTRIPFIRLPVSTEQVLHPEAYGDSLDMPTAVELPPPSAGEVLYQNNLGEFESRLLLYQWSRDQAAAIRAAAGWDGDRYVLFRAPEGEGLAWVTVWDSPVEAGEFYDVLDRSLARRYTDLRVENISAQERRYTGGDRAMRATALEIDGRPAVLFVDMPRGARTDDVLDVSRIRLREESVPPRPEPPADSLLVQR